LPIVKSDWKTEEKPKNMRQLPYERFFYDSEAKKILDGFKPRDMDDKWFIYAEEGWVYFIINQAVAVSMVATFEP
jgi:hypothetical protein